MLSWETMLLGLRNPKRAAALFWSWPPFWGWFRGTPKGPPETRWGAHFPACPKPVIGVPFSTVSTPALGRAVDTDPFSPARMNPCPKLLGAVMPGLRCAWFFEATSSEDQTFGKIQLGLICSMVRCCFFPHQLRAFRVQTGLCWGLLLGCHLDLWFPFNTFGL